MDTSTFLDHHGVSLKEVSEAIHRRTGGRSDEVLFLAGSLIEGLGNTRSDLDAVLVTDRRPGEVRPGEPIPVWTEPFLLDVEWWPRTDVTALTGVLAALPADQERDPRSAESFGAVELRLLHRLWHGEPLQAQAELEALQARLDSRALARLLVDRAVVEVEAQQTDVVGFVEVGDLQSALLQAIEMAGHTADALLAAAGDTNPGRKWRLARLRALGNPGPELPGGPLSPSPAEAFVRLWVARSVAPAAVRRRLAECVHLANRVVPWARRRFLPPAPSRPPEVRPAREGNGDTRHGGPTLCEGLSEEPGSVLSAPRLDLRARWLDGRLEVTCPAWPDPLVADDLTHEALLCFDGRTTLAEAVERLGERTGAAEETARATLRALARRLARQVQPS